MSETLCASCGAQLEPGGKFCPVCGTLVTAQTPTPQYQPPAYQPPVYQPPIYQPPSPMQGQQLAPVLSLGSYIGMMIIACIPLVGFILLLVWAFSSAENPNKKNYARAVLLISVILSALSLLIMMLAGGALMALISDPSFIY